MRRLPTTLLLTTLLFCAFPTNAAVLHPFTTDGCSLFPNGTPSQQDLWLGCCIAHDRAYWLGGAFLERLEADQALLKCVARVGEPEIALLMLAGVRVGGTPFLPTPFRWGYGWDEPRGYRSLTPEERAQADALTGQNPAPVTGIPLDPAF